MSALPRHTFQDSGITVQIRKISPSLIAAIEQAARRDLDDSRPRPPVVETPLGARENLADGDYQQALREWTTRVNLEVGHRGLIAAALNVVCEIDAEAVAHARRLAHVTRSAILTDCDDELSDEEKNLIVYVLRVCCASTEDLNEFQRAALWRVTPSPEEVDRAIATFRPDVER